MVIPIGAKVIIHHTRGGIVVLPITPEAGTGVVDVDVPTISSAAVDPADHNFWFLKWTPGANNTNTSVNVQITAYPTAPGVVGGVGTTTGLYPVTVPTLRVRFSGPSTTYYIKLWGERNGKFSATGVTATITSGSDVTVPTDIVEPEPFKQRASMSWGDAQFQNGTTQWFNDGYLMAVATYRLELTGWSGAWDPPYSGWWEQIGSVGTFKAGAPGGVPLALVLGTTEKSVRYDGIDGSITVTSKTFSSETSTLVLHFTTTTIGKIGMRVVDSNYPDNHGSMWIVLTQL